LAVVPNPNGDGHRFRTSADSIFDLAEDAGTTAVGGTGGGGGGDGGTTRRTITMYRSGFTVDDGPHRRLDDPSNAEFLTSLAGGRIPRELSSNNEGMMASAEVTVGLVDRRGEEYDPERHGGGGGEGGGFQSFSGEGQSLGGSSSAASSSSPTGGGGGGGIVDPSVVLSTAPAPPETVDESRPITTVAVRLLDGKRLVVRMNADGTLRELAIRIANNNSNATDRYVFTSGYPPTIIDDLESTIEGAGLMGAQVVLRRA
jgi:UBX domain-containing protein 1